MPKTTQTIEWFDKDYKIEVDEVPNYTLMERKITEDSHLTKQENIGKEYYVTIGYFKNPQHALERYLKCKAFTAGETIQIEDYIVRLEKLQKEILNFLKEKKK
jgi:hypothetical protein